MGVMSGLGGVLTRYFLNVSSFVNFLIRGQKAGFPLLCSAKQWESWRDENLLVFNILNHRIKCQLPEKKIKKEEVE